MSIRIFPDANALAQESARVIRDFIAKKPDALFCFAAGRTQIPTYTILADWAKKGEVDLSRIRAVGLDDIVGSSRERREGFHFFLDTHLFDPAGIAQSQVTFMNALAPDIKAECKNVDAWLDQHGPIDFLLLGIGGNGHIGYNEPGSSVDGRTHTVELEHSSVAAGQTYFDHSFEANRGITLGLRDLLAARTILVQANGTAKKAAYDRVNAGEITAEAPVTYLLSRTEGVEFFFDEAATTGRE